MTDKDTSQNMPQYPQDETPKDPVSDPQTDTERRDAAEVAPEAANDGAETSDAKPDEPVRAKGTIKEEAKAKRKAERRAAKPQVDRRNKTLRRFSIVSIIFVIVALILLNVLLEVVVGDRLAFDWSANKVMSLGDTSKELLNELDKPVEITVLTTRENLEDGRAQINFVPALLDDYVQRSNGKVSVEYVNTTLNPTILKELDPDGVNNIQTGMLVVQNPETKRLRALNPNNFVNVQMNQQYQQVITGYTAEQEISGAIKSVSAEYSPVIYVTSGHGETDVNAYYQTFMSLLRGNNFEIEVFNGMQGNPVPDDAEALIMLNPTSDISSDEVNLYMDYLKSGGSLIALVPFSGVSYPNLNALLSEFNLRLTDNRVIEGDPAFQYGEEQESIIAHNPAGKILEATGTELPEAATLIMNARGIETAQNAKEWIETEAVLTTSEKGAYQIAGDPENLSESGTQNLAMYSENRGFVDGNTVKDPAKVLLFGSDMIFADSVLQYMSRYFLNMVYAYQSVASMVDLEAAAGSDLFIRPRPVVSYNVRPTDPGQLRIAALVTTVIIPLILIITAVVVYRRRKNL